MHITAIAIPFPTLPCSNCLLIYVETVKVLVGAMREGVTSSRNAIMNVIIQPDIIPLDIRGNVMWRNTYPGVPPEILPAATRLGLICEYDDVTYCTVYGRNSTT